MFDLQRPAEHEGQREQSADQLDYAARLAVLAERGIDPYPSFRSVMCGHDVVVGRILAISEARLTMAYPSQDQVWHFEVGQGVGDLLTHLRPGDVVAVRTRGDQVVEVQPVVVARRTLEGPNLSSHQPLTSQREQELFWSATTRATFRDTAKIVAASHFYLQERDFIEVAMPVLTTNPDISPNCPFRVEVSDGSLLHLRTTYPYSERLLYSLERIYQIGPSFRDEPPGPERRPEFNMLSIGKAMADYEEMMDLGEDLLREIALAIRGTTKVEFRGVEVNLAQPWRRMPVSEALAEHVGLDIDQCFELDQLEVIVHNLGLPLPDSAFDGTGGQIFHGAVFDVLLRTLVYPRLMQPTFLTEFPYFFGGPGRPVDAARKFKMRAEGFVAGVEVCETASVLTDPRVIRKWHNDVLAEKRSIGWDQLEDHAYLDTIDRGLLLPSVIAFGMERLFMLILGKALIDEVIWYSHEV